MTTTTILRLLRQPKILLRKRYDPGPRSRIRSAFSIEYSDCPSPQYDVASSGCLSGNALSQTAERCLGALLAMEHYSTTVKLDHRAKRTTSVRLENLEHLERVVREFGFKDRSHFFQLCTDALIRAHSESQRLDWPPRFATRHEEETRDNGALRSG